MIKNLIIDFNRTIYDTDTQSFLEDALKGLKSFKEKGLYLRLVSKGDKDAVIPILENSGAHLFFNEISIDENKEKFFTEVFDPSSWLVIGDRVRKEILFGGQLGMKTIWLKKGKFSTEEPQTDQKPPDYIVSSWSEIIKILEEI